MMRTSCRKGKGRGGWAVAVALVVTSLLPAACGGSPAGPAAGSADNMTWFFWVGSPGENAVWQRNADLVSKTYPNLSVSLTTTSFGDFWSKLPLEAWAHAMPCIAGLQYGYVGSVGNLFIPLNSLIKKYHHSLTSFDPGMIKELSDDGNVLALPYDFGPVVIAYNKALFKAKGVPYPQDGWTWSQFLQDAKRLTGGGDDGYLPGQSLLEVAYDLTGTPDASSRTVRSTSPTPRSSKESRSRPSSPTRTTSRRRTPRPQLGHPGVRQRRRGHAGHRPVGPDRHQGSDQLPAGVGRVSGRPKGMHTYNEGSGSGLPGTAAHPMRPSRR